MLKRDEVGRPDSCLGRALDHEQTFVLLARDESAPATIRWWAADRVRRGKSRPEDPEILDAERIAREMEESRDAIRAELAAGARPSNHPTEIGLKNLNPGDRVSARRPCDGAWVPVELVRRIDVHWMQDLAVGPFWTVRDDAGSQWESSGEMMEPLP